MSLLGFDINEYLKCSDRTNETLVLFISVFETYAAVLYFATKVFTPGGLFTSLC